MAKFPFHDLHSFKDYVGFVKLCAPDKFPARESVGPDDQWSLELAFKGLQHGLALAVTEKGSSKAFNECETLFSEAYSEYLAGRIKQGHDKLAEAKKRLGKIPSQ